ncbi:MAG TPA: hypothetical protein VNO52_00240, partial [Methylomirabilota bacterium]|nr:hypothetical protein [Methylomirabilota bacterium]
RREFFPAPGDKNWLNGFYVVDVSSPTRPRVRGRIENRDGAFFGVAIKGAYAYVACGERGVGVVDLTNPDAPVLAGAFDTTGWAFAVFVDGDHLYVADGSRGLRILDIRNPLAPAPLDPGDPAAGVIEVAGNVQDVVVAGSKAYLAAASSFHVVDVTRKATPVLAGSYPLGHPHTALRVTVAGNLAYVATSTGGTVLFDVSQPESPSKLSGFAATGGWGATTLSVALRGNQAFVANGPGGLAVVQAGDPARPVVASNFRHWFEGRQMAAGTGLALVTGVEYWEGGTRSTNGIRILDTSIPHQPRVVGRLDSVWDSYLGAALAGQHAYVARGLAGVAVFSLTNPAAPILVGTNDTPGWATDVFVEGTNLFIADGMQGLRILDLSNPAAPAPLSVNNPGQGVLSVGANVRDVFVSGQYAYLCTGNSFRIVDIRDRRVPVLRGTLTLGYPYTLLRSRVEEGYAYVACSAGGLAVIDVRDPAGPVLVGSVAPNGDVGALTVDVTVVGTTALVSNGEGGVGVFDVTDPTAPRLMHSVPTPGGAGELALIDGWLYVTDSMGVMDSINLRP